MSDERERLRPATGPAFTDAVTFAFGDARAGVYGLARLGVSPGGAGSALAVLFSGREPVTAIARGALELPEGADWDAIALGGLRATTEAPMSRWTVAMEGEEAAGFALTFEALGPPAELDAASPVVAAGGMEGYEQVCLVRGTVRAEGRTHDVRCLGQRGHSWGEPDWRRLEAARTVSAWPDGGSAVTLTSVREAGAPGHDAEPMWAALLDTDGTRVIAEPRLSTTYDGGGRQRRAALELWVHDDDGHPWRGSGDVVCGSTLDLGQLRLDCAFFLWRLEGREGIGRYDVLRRTSS